MILATETVGTFKTFLAQPGSAEEKVVNLRAMLIQGVMDGGFENATKLSLPAYKITDQLTAKMYVRDVAVWIYNLPRGEQKRLMRMEVLFP